MVPYLLYLHGFNSSPQSFKAQVLKSWLDRHRPDLALEIPSLPFSPAEAIELLEAQYFRQPEDYPAGIIGSSLGGYYALNLSVRYEVPAVLINPAVKPHRLLADYLGVNTNLYTGEQYELGLHHMDELLALDVDPPISPCQTLTLLQTGDETLDYREAIEKLDRTSLWVIPGGNHEFEDFQLVIPAVLGHFGLAAGEGNPATEE